MTHKQAATNSAPRHYAAFISYRHLSPDQEVARALHKMLEHNQVRPSRHVPRNIRPVFLDTGELPTLESLDAGIYQALDNSDCLFVVCSPNLPLSRYCMREIEYFKKIHGGRLSRIYTVLAAGEPGEAFPEVLRTESRTLPDGTVEVTEIEPLFADVRAPSVSLSLKKLKKTEYLRLAAAYYGCSYDALFKRHRRWVWRIASFVAAGILLVAAGFGAYTWYSRMKYDSAKAAAYAAYSEDRTRAGDEQLAILLAREGWDSAVSSGSSRLTTAMRSAAVQYDYRTRAMPAAPALSVSYDPDRNSVFYLSDDGSKAVTYGSNILQISDVSTGAVQQRLPMDSAFLLGTNASRYVTIRAEADSSGVLWDTAALWTIGDNRMIGSFPFRRSGRDFPSYSVVTAVETPEVIIIMDHQKPVAYMDTSGRPLSMEEAADLMLTTMEPAQVPETPFRCIQGGTKLKNGRRVTEPFHIESDTGETMLTFETAPKAYSFSPDWVYFACAESGTVRIYDTETWTLQAELPQDDTILRKIHLLRGAPYLLLHEADAAGRNTARLVDWRTSELLLTAEGYPCVSPTDCSFYCWTADQWTRYTYRPADTEKYRVLAQKGSLCLAAGETCCRLLNTSSGKILFQADGIGSEDISAADDISRILVRLDGRISCLNSSGTLLWEKEASAGCISLSPDGSAAAWTDEQGIRVVNAADGSPLFSVSSGAPDFPDYPFMLAAGKSGVCVIGIKNAVWFAPDGSGVSLGDYDYARLYTDGLLFLQSSTAYIRDFAVWNTTAHCFIYQPSENTGPWAYHVSSGWLVRQIETSGSHETWTLELLSCRNGAFESRSRITLPALSVSSLRLDSSGLYMSVTAGETTRIYLLKDQSLLLSVDSCPLFLEDGSFRALEFRGTAQYSAPFLEGTDLLNFALSLVTGPDSTRTLSPEELSRYSFSE